MTGEIYEKLTKCYEDIGIIAYDKEDIDIRDYDIDSVMFMSLIINIEQEFNIIIPDYLMDYEAFISAKAVAEYIEEIV